MFVLPESRKMVDQGVLGLDMAVFYVAEEGTEGVQYNRLPHRNLMTSEVRQFGRGYV